MAKVEEKRGREEQKQAPAPARAEAVPQRRVALCIESCTICLGPGTTTVFGGEFITDAQHVKLAERDPHFKVFEGSYEEISKTMSDHAAAFERMKAEGAALGFMVSRHGELALPKRR